MKKYIVLFLLVIILTGCGKTSDSNIISKFVKSVEKKDAYLMKGTMNIISNEDTFTYTITAAKKDTNYRVNLTNQINNHEQVILKNSEGVYV